MHVRNRNTFKSYFGFILRENHSWYQHKFKHINHEKNIKTNLGLSEFFTEVKDKLLGDKRESSYISK